MNSNIKRFGKVAVLMGGLSAEREVSLMSGNEVLKALLRKGVDAHKVDVQHDIVDKLQHGNFDRAFIVLHGPGGEDGMIQSVLQTMQIPYTGSNVESSAIAMNKVITKLILQSVNLPTLPFVFFNKNFNVDEIKERFSLPWCVKPVHEGSSNGVSKVTKLSEFDLAYKKARKYEAAIMLEPWVNGREFSVSILQGEVLPPVGISPTGDFYDYFSKYDDSSKTKYYCPCNLDESEIEYMKKIAKQAFDIVGCSGWGRIDFLRDNNGKFWLSEINTVPGMTVHSLVPMGAKEAGISFEDLVLRVLESSFK